MNNRHSWAAYAAVAGGAALLLKAVLIIASEDTIANAPMAVLYLGGILLGLAAAIGTGLRQRRGRRAGTAVGLCLLIVAFVMVLSDGIESAFKVISDAPWVVEEGPIGLLGVALLALGARSRAAEREPALV